MTEEDIRNLERVASAASEAARNQWAKVERAKKAAEIEALRPMRAAAKRAHDILCRYNHTDGCGWGYEEGLDAEKTWAASSHYYWLKSIREAMEGSNNRPPLSIEKLNAILDAVEQIKKVHPDAVWLIAYGIGPR